MEFRFAEEQPQDDYAAELAGIKFICLFSNVNLLIIATPLRGLNGVQMMQPSF